VEAVSISTQDYTGIFVQVRQGLANVGADFAKIRHDFGQMRVNFKTPTPTQ